MRKLKLFFTSVLCLIVGLSVGFVGNIFLTLPESYVIPEKIEDICHVDSYQTPNKIASSTATTETGAEIRVPLFINEGDKVKINTEDGSYVERVKD